MRLCSSEVKSTSLAVVRSISSTKPSSDSRMLRWELEANSPKANRCFMSMMSSAMDSATPGRRTFTATVVPSSSVALCTWAMEAAPKGTGSMEANTSCHDFPYARSICSITTSNGIGFASSRSFSKASQ